MGKRKAVTCGKQQIHLKLFALQRVLARFAVDMFPLRRRNVVTLKFDYSSEGSSWGELWDLRNR